MYLKRILKDFLLVTLFHLLNNWPKNINNCDQKKKEYKELIKNFHLTIEENLKVISTYHNQNYDIRVFNDSLLELNIRQFKEMPLKLLSRGNIQRNKLCLAMNLNWDYLLIDEPFSNLDTDGIKIFKDIFNNFKSNNRSIIYSTHQNYQELNYDKIISIESFKGIK